MPAISVIIPTFNRASFLAECIDSVMNQSIQDFELIVVDDGSTDQTEQILSSNPDKIQYLRQENRGPSAARNAGIMHAKGEWLAFLDSDDLWQPEKLDRQMNYVQAHPETKICYTEEIWYRKGRRVNPRKIHAKHSGWIYQQMLPLCIVSPSSVMIHHSVFDEAGLFDESLPACEDYDLWLRIGSRYSINLISEPLIIKRNGHEGQQSQKFWGMDRFRIQALQKMLNLNILSTRDFKATRETLITKATVFIAGCEKRGKFDEADQYRKIISSYTNHGGRHG